MSHTSPNKVNHTHSPPPSKSSQRSSVAALRARRAAAEALHRRQQLERELKLAQREQERDRHLAAIQQEVEDCELQAEIAALEAEASSSRKSGSYVSQDRTTKWVKAHNCKNSDRDPYAEECDILHGTLPGHAVPPACLATQDPASPIIPTTVTIRPKNVTKATGVSEVKDSYPPLNATENHQSQSAVLLQAVADTAAAAKALASGHQGKSLPTLPTFSGDTLQWLHFKRIFNFSKHNFSPLENIARLQNCLRGAAYEAVASILLSSEDPEEIMCALEDNFARPELVVIKEVAALKGLPRLSTDLKELGTITNQVRNSVSTIRLLNQVEYLYSPELYYAVLSKLNPTMKPRWSDFASQDTTQRPKLEILSDFLKRELDQHVRFTLSPETIAPTKLQQFASHAQTQAHRHNINIHSTSSVSKPKSINSKPIQVSSTKQECSYCKKDHNIKSCLEFKRLSVDDRWRWLHEARVCYRCLRKTSHQWKTCKVNSCGIDGCAFRHHPLLHGRQTPLQNNIVHTLGNENVLDSSVNISRKPEPGTSGDLSNSEEEKVIVSVNASSHVKTLLKLVPVTVSGPTGNVDTFALLDDGSTDTFIDATIASRIGVTGPEETITVNCFSGLSRKSKSERVNLHIKGRFTQADTFLISARTVDSLALQPQTISKELIMSCSHLVDLVDVLSYVDARPMVLIGADHWYLSISEEVRKGSRNMPVACSTALGWVLYGMASSKTKTIDFVNHVSITDEPTDSLEFLVKEHYKLESLGISKLETLHTKQDKRAVEIIESTCKRLPSGRFEVGLPWKENITHVPDSYAQALSRFLTLERRMRKDAEFAQGYHVFFKNMSDREYFEQCHPSTYHNYSKLDAPGRIRWYLPHFGVHHPQKRKLRIVHDAAALNEGVSLNSMLLPGPDLLQCLLGILFRFREGRVAFVADIKEMFPQFKIREEDRDALRFLWRPEANSGSEKHPIIECRMTSLIFGACSSPFIAQYLKNKNARGFAQSHPLAVNAILHDHYMDDYLGSHDDVHEAAQIAADIVTIHKKACLEMRGWISNKQAALSLLPAESLAVQPLEINLCSNSTSIGALGIVWHPTSDLLGFRTGLDNLIPKSFTKRKVLSHLMRLYDPLGLLGPITIKGRILFQQTWRSNIEWDTEFSPSEASKWFEWFQAVAEVATIRVPRWYASCLNSEPTYRELHIFADASEHAYACVAYWRLVYENNSVQVVLISSKTRVSPLKPLSIPRLELQAALIASRLAVTIKVSHKKKPSRTIFWSDSMTVLGWLRSDARTFKPFVAHRIGEIIENSSVTDWRWVPSDLNVADDATRPRNLQLSTSSRWFTGPPFLSKPLEEWPVEPTGLAPVREELKATELVGLLAINTVSWPEPITAPFNRFSDWLRLLRTTARIVQAVEIFKSLRFDRVRSRESTHRSRNTVSAREQIATPTTLIPLTACHLKAAERQILLRTQLDSFREEIHCLLQSRPIPKKSRLLKLSPMLGDDHVLRLAGRVSAVVDIRPEVCRPFLLDGKHPVVQLLVQHFHRRIAGHGNNEMVINELRQKYWIVHLRPTVRRVANSCDFCHIRKAQPIIPVTGDLPPERMAHHQRPFTFTGLDYFGPINVTIGRRHEKRYVALFTCLTTRAIHLELVHSLSADSAIMSLRRFIARRGAPSTIFSDNGTAFVGASRLLKEFYHSTVNEFVANHQISWRFIPPAAPSFGGCWERMVRTVKAALGATLRERAPKEEVLCTLLLEAEAIVNSRPLSHVSVSPDDPETLTPFHFLIGSSSPHSLISSSLSDNDLFGRAEYRRALRLADHFWSRWVKEILPMLQLRQPGGQRTRFEVGDTVLIVDGELPRGTWPRGRISAVYPGRDGVVRVVDVATAGGTLRRPTRKIVRLRT